MLMERLLHCNRDNLCDGLGAGQVIVLGRQPVLVELNSCDEAGILDEPEHCFGHHWRILGSAVHGILDQHLSKALQRGKNVVWANTDTLLQLRAHRQT